MPKEIISEEETTLPRVKKLLSQRGKEGELSFQQNITLEHASTFSKMAPAVADKLVERLIKSFGISRAHAVQVVNIAPTTPEEIRTILDARSTDVTDEQIAEIVEIMVKAIS
ncbi:MAG: RNA polymerase Rpb4 family protein [Promethearchaeota archaeon]